MREFCGHAQFLQSFRRFEPKLGEIRSIQGNQVKLWYFTHDRKASNEIPKASNEINYSNCITAILQLGYDNFLTTKGIYVIEAS